MGGMEKLELRNWGVREASRVKYLQMIAPSIRNQGGRDVPPKSLVGPIRRSDRLGSGRLTVETSLLPHKLTELCIRQKI